MELQQQLPQLGGRGLGLAAISYDSTTILAAFSREHGITFPLLSDVGSVTIRRYGILNTVAQEALGPAASDPDVVARTRVFATLLPAAERLRGIPFPGTFIVDRGGRVQARFFESFFRERNTVSNILMALGSGRAPLAGVQVSNGQLDLRAYASDTTVALGNRFSLVLEITPRPGMHVYAPGVEGYLPVALTITPRRFIRVLPARYPPSEPYVFKPLNERVPVYRKPFTIIQEIVPEVTDEAQAAFKAIDTLTIAGALSYQACDDKLCYNPMSIPLAWTVALRPIERP